MSEDRPLPLRKNIAEMAGYVPGMQPKEGGYIKLNTNENPYPPSPKVVEAIHAGNGEMLRQYPEADSGTARQAAAAVYGFPPEWIIMGNGSDEILNNLIRAFVDQGEVIGHFDPSYSYYQTLADIQGAKTVGFPIDDTGVPLEFPETFTGKLFFLTSPNAPLGSYYDTEWIEELLPRMGEAILVIDEAYADFAQGNGLELVRKYPNVVVTRTFSKSYALAGMRLGLAIANPEIITALNKIRDHYNLDRLAQAAAAAALTDQDYLAEQVKRVCVTRERVRGELLDLRFAVPESAGNYLFVIPPDRDGKRVYDILFAEKILVRHFSSDRLKHGVRISIGTEEEMTRLLTVLKGVEY